MKKKSFEFEEEDLFNDAMCYYKDPNFDARKRIRVMYQGQPAVDTWRSHKAIFHESAKHNW